MLVPLLFTFLAGFFIVIGSCVVFFTKHNQKFVQFSIGMAFGVMVTLVLFELFPEASELLCSAFGNTNGYIIFIVLAFAGGGMLKLLDLVVPNHCHHDIHEEMDNDNLYHIGLVASIALILHNLIEGMSIYATTTKSIDMGLMLTLGVGFHNIPMGIVIASTFESMKGKKKFLAILCIVTASTFVGGFAMAFFNAYISDSLLGILLGLTFGMLVYIILFELLHEMIHSKSKKISMLGLITGIFIFLISLFLE